MRTKVPQRGQVAFVVASTVTAIVAAALGLEGAGQAATVAANRARGSTPTLRTVLIGSVRVRVETSPNEVVCYEALRPGVPSEHTVLRACVKHLRAAEIAFVVGTRHTRQQMIAGLAGDRVARVFVRLTPRRTWTPRRVDGAFFGYVPVPYQVAAVVKVLDDGTRRSFAVRPAH